MSSNSVRAELEAAEERVKKMQSEEEAKKNKDNRTDDEKLADSLGIDRKALPMLLEKFAAFDKDGDGTIDVEELGTVLASLGRQTSEQKVREMIQEFNAGAEDAAEISFKVFLDIVASGAIDIAALTGKSETNPDGHMEHSMWHKTFKPKVIMKIRLAVERDNVKSLKALMEEYDFDVNCTLNFLVRSFQLRMLLRSHAFITCVTQPVSLLGQGVSVEP